MEDIESMEHRIEHYWTYIIKKIWKKTVKKRINISSTN